MNTQRSLKKKNLFYPLAIDESDEELQEQVISQTYLKEQADFFDTSSGERYVYFDGYEENDLPDKFDNKELDFW